MGIRTAFLLLFAGSAAGCGRTALHGVAQPLPDAGSDSARGAGGLLLNLGRGGAGGIAGSGGSEEPWNFGGYGGGVPTALQGEMVTLASGQGDPVSIAVDDTTVYWGNTLLSNADVGTTIVSVPIEGGPPTILVRSFRVGGIAISGDDLYWTAYNTADDPTSSLMRMPKQGGSPVKLGSGLMPDQIAVRPDAVYGTGEADNGFVAARIATGDGAFRTLMSPAAADTSPSMSHAVAVDVSNVYWGTSNNFSARSTITKIPLDGGAPTVFASAWAAGWGIAIDSTSVYWVTSSAVLKIPLGGGSPQTLAPNQGTKGVEGIAVDETNVYWTDGGNPGNVSKVSINGGPVTVLATGLQHPAGIVVDHTSVYWANTFLGTGHGYIMKLTPK